MSKSEVNRRKISSGEIFRRRPSGLSIAEWANIGLRSAQETVDRHTRTASGLSPAEWEEIKKRPDLPRR